MREIMMRPPKFSIVIPVYNVENYLSQCLDSVVRQTLLDIEIICVNDGTKDRSRSVLEEYKNIDNRIQIIDKENGGLSSARNAGLEVATGEYILFLDSDDYLEEKTCERLYYETLENQPDIIVFGAHIFPYYPWPDEWLIRNLSPRTVAYQNHGVYALLNENGAYPFVWRNCFNRTFLSKNNLTFDETVRFGEDIIFQFMSFPQTEKIIFISDKLYHYRWSRTGSLMANASKDVYKKYLQHINAMRIIAQKWKQLGLLEKYKKEFLAWTVSFMGWDLYNYSGPQKSDLIQRTRDFWKEYELLSSDAGLSGKDRIYYHYIRSYL